MNFHFSATSPAASQAGPSASQPPAPATVSAAVPQTPSAGDVLAAALTGKSKDGAEEDKGLAKWFGQNIPAPTPAEGEEAAGASKPRHCSPCRLQTKPFGTGNQGCLAKATCTKANSIDPALCFLSFAY